MQLIPILLRLTVPFFTCPAPRSYSGDPGHGTGSSAGRVDCRWTICLKIRQPILAQGIREIAITNHANVHQPSNIYIY